MSTKKGFMVFDWMVTEKGLSGNELVCYAFLNEQTNHGEQTYNGGYEGIASAIGVTFPTAYSLLRKMKDKGLVDYDAVSVVRLVA